MIKSTTYPLLLHIALACIVAACGPAVAFAADEILVLYNERIPYMVISPGGEVSGLTASPVRYAFEKSGLAHRWQLTPTKRQMDTLEFSRERACAIGWFKNPEREKFAKYTVELYRDKAAVAVAKTDNARIASGRTLDETFADKGLTLLAKAGYSYGEFIDRKIRQLAPRKAETVNENMDMLKIIHAGRADYMFMAPEEAEALIASSNFRPEEFKLVTFTDMPEGESRYLLCSRQVLDAEIETLNVYLKEYRANHQQK